MQPVDVAAVVIDTHERRGEFGPHSVVAADPFLLDSAVGRFVARVDARGAADGEQDHQRVLEMLGVLQLAGDPGDVVVADEGHRDERIEKVVVPLQRPVELVEVTVVQAAPCRLPQLVLGDRVEAGFADMRGVVPVDDFADEPCVAELLPNPRQHLRPEPVRDGVGRVETPSVGSTTQPVRHHVDGVVHHIGVVVVEGDQLAVALECLEVVAGAAEPRGVGSCDGVAIARKVGSDMVEDTVEQDTQTPPVCFGDQFVEILVVTESRVDPIVVGGVVAVRARGEYRTERDTGGAEFDGVIEPFDDATQPVLVGARRRIGGKRADEAERIDLPPDRVLRPTPVRSWSRTSPRRATSWCRRTRARARRDDPGATVLIGSGATGRRLGAPFGEPLGQLCRRGGVDDAAEADPGVAGRAHRAVLAGGVDSRVRPLGAESGWPPPTGRWRTRDGGWH